MLNIGCELLGAFVVYFTFGHWKVGSVLNKGFGLIWVPNATRMLDAGLCQI